MGLPVLFPLVFGVLGGITSTVAGILVGNRFGYISFVTLLSTLVFAGLGFGIYTLLEKKVPEFLEFLGTISLSEFRFSTGSSEDTYGSGDFSSGSGSGSGGGDYGASSLDSSGESYVQKSSSKPQKVGDTLVIDKIVLKNEPKLMAEAIRTIMSKDDIQDS